MVRTIVREMFADLHPVHALAMLIVRRSHPKRAMQKINVIKQ